MEEEIWKNIKGYEGLYQISNLKRIKSLKRISYNGKLLREKILKYTKHGNYDTVWLSKNNNSKLYYVDKLYYLNFEKGE